MKIKLIILLIQNAMKTTDCSSNHHYRNVGIYALYAAGIIILLLQIRSIFA